MRGLVSTFRQRPVREAAEPLGARMTARRVHAAALLGAGFLRRARRSELGLATASSPSGSRRISSSASRASAEIAQRGVELELRNALEPWHVLGEEPGGGGTVRYVDSTVERLQVKVDGLNDARHVIACNGWRLPLHAHRQRRRIRRRSARATAPGRRRAELAASDSPTRMRRSPSTSTLRWSGRSIGGCTDIVSHPGGRSHDRVPVNINEAEARRRGPLLPDRSGHGGTWPPSRGGSTIRSIR